MSRSICILFVALAIFQAAVADVVEETEIVDLNSTEVVGSPNDVFGITRGSCSNGALTVGRRRSDETIGFVEYKYNNDKDVEMTVKVRVAVKRGTTIHYVSAVNKSGYSVRMCDTTKTLGSDKTLVVIKVPPHSNARIDFTIGTH